MEENKFIIGEDSNPTTATKIQRSTSGNGTKRFKKGHLKRRSSGKLSGPKYFMQTTSSDNIHGGFRRTQSQQSLSSIQFTSLKQSDSKKKKKDVKAPPSSSTPSTSTSSTTIPSKNMDQHTSTILNNDSIPVKNKNKEITAPLRAVSSSMTNLKTFSTPKPTMIMMCAKPIQQSLHVVVSDRDNELLKKGRNDFLSQDINTNNPSTSKRISSLRYLQNYSSNTITNDDSKIIKKNQQQRTSHFLYNDIDYPSPILSPPTATSFSSFHYNNNYFPPASSFAFNSIQELLNEYQTIQQFYDPMTESLLRCMNKVPTSSLPSSSLVKKKQSGLSTSLSTSSSATTSTFNSSNVSSSPTTSIQSHHTPNASTSFSFHPTSCMKLNYHEQQHHHHHHNFHRHQRHQRHYIPSSSDIKDSLIDTTHYDHQQQHHPHTYQRQYIHKCHIKKQLFDQQQQHYHNHHPIVNTDEYYYSLSNPSNSYNSYWVSTLWSRVKNGIIKHHH
ncbi:hypothetical protein BJ944DRAFT_266916 [Cunninghamella echinulata]|nr:hypothetical protein BJ944DRAFT_266916 [Cunninghamella echinulata]